MGKEKLYTRNVFDFVFLLSVTYFLFHSLFLPNSVIFFSYDSHVYTTVIWFYDGALSSSRLFLFRLSSLILCFFLTLAVFFCVWLILTLFLIKPYVYSSLTLIIVFIHQEYFSVLFSLLSFSDFGFFFSSSLISSSILSFFLLTPTLVYYWYMFLLLTLD